MLLLQDQQTPLHLSSESGHVDIVTILLRYGADIHVKDRVRNIMLGSCLLNNLKLCYKIQMIIMI